MDNLNQFDFNKLTILWQATERIPEQRKHIENVLREKIEGNKKFSREFIFDAFYIRKKAIGISFVPTSNSFKKYGETVVIDAEYSGDEVIELLKNIRCKPPKNTFGIIRGKALYEEGLNKNQIDDLKVNGFNTKDILSVIVIK